MMFKVRRRYPPGPKISLLGSLFRAHGNNAAEGLRQIAARYGDIAHFRVWGEHFYLLSHPEHIKEVLVTRNRDFIRARGVERLKRLLGEGVLTSDGQAHLRQRRTIQPAFNPKQVEAYGDTMTACAVKMRESWQEGTTLDVDQEMRRLSVTIVGKTLLGADLESESREMSHALMMTAKIHLAMLPFPKFFEKLPLPINRRFQKARAVLDNTVYRVIARRRERDDNRGDMLSLLLHAPSPDGNGDTLTDEQIRDNAMNMIFAGGHAMATALTWTWYLLSQHPDIERRVHAEIDSVLVGRLPTVEDLPQLQYVTMVFLESMRLYPPQWTTNRRPLRDFQVGQYIVPNGSIVMTSQYVVHRDARHYPDPLRFIPERWTPDAQARRPKFAYFPFGSGLRVCIGESFSPMQGVLILATLAQKWRLELAPGAVIDIWPAATLRPKYGMPMVLERRCC